MITKTPAFSPCAAKPLAGGDVRRQGAERAREADRGGR